MVISKKIKADENCETFVNLFNGVLNLSLREKQVLTSVLEDSENPFKVATEKYALNKNTYNTYYYRLKARGLFENEYINKLFTYYKDTGLIVFKIVTDE